MSRWDQFRKLAAAYEGPIPPAERAAARWGPGAWTRLTRGADAALIETRLREAVAALGRLRRAGGVKAVVLERVVRAVATYRSLSIALRGANGACAVSR